MVITRDANNFFTSTEYDSMPQTRRRRLTIQYYAVLGSIVIIIAIIGLQTDSTMEHRQLQSSIPVYKSTLDLTSDQSNVEGPAVVGPPRDCSIPRPEPKEMMATIIASYPGSGAKLTWKLIRAVTGIMTGDDYNNNGLVSLGQVVSLKTHYPAECCSDPVRFEPFLNKDNFDQSVLLLRHPINALPSYHNFFYEQEQNLKNHSTRAPVDVWIEWRDQHFEEHLATWTNGVKFWMKHHEYEHRLVITYENIINAETGPNELYKLGRFVMRGGDLAGPEEDIVCVWDYIVNQRTDEATRRSSKRSDGPTERPYTTDQLNRIIDELKMLKDLYPGQLGPIVDEYLRTVYRNQESIPAAPDILYDLSDASTAISQ